MSATTRLAFFTIGESPRSDVVPGMLDILGAHVRVDEFGVLDGLDAASRAALAPRPDAYRFATRLNDGSGIALDREATEARLADLMRSADSAGYDALIPLCTGTALPRLNTLVLEPQQIIDHALVGLARHCTRIGILVPLAAQVDHFEMIAPLPCSTLTESATPYADTDTTRAQLQHAATALRDCDLIVMHCMGYQGWMRRVVAEVSGRPTLLSNHMVASTLAQMFT